MPTYDYVCANGHRFEVIHGVHDAGPTACPVCGSEDVRKAFAPPAIHFKGSGWAKKDRGSSARKSSSGSSDTASGGDKAATTSTTSDSTSSGGSSSSPDAKPSSGGSGSSSSASSGEAG